MSATRTIHIALESPRSADVLALVEALDAYQMPLYPPGSHHGIDIDALAAPNVRFAVARTAAGEAVGCGALVLDVEGGELKRMYTKPEHRGLGVAGRLLAFLEEVARRERCECLVLETGYLQHEALAFYAKHGFERCGPFGSYVEDPNSVFMRKVLR